MKSFKSFFVTAALALISSTPAYSAIKSKSQAVSEMQGYNYVCMHVTKPEALVFKTSSPQKIWRTTVDREGQIKKGKGFELSQIQINAETIEKEGELASFKANLAKDYQIKGFFSKDTDGDLPLTVVSTYIPEGTLSQIKDNYNCEALASNKLLKLGSVNKE